MKNKRRLLYLIIIAAAVCVYVLLLIILTHAEARDPSSSIHSLWDAFWYSLATLTTVGYGDVAPVTPLGRAIGIFFLILSLGILVALVGTLVSFLASEGFPLFRLSFQKKKNWYYFADHGLEADALARQILRDDPRAVIIYGQSQEALETKPDYPCLFIDVSPERIANRKKGKGNRCLVFLMKENDIGVNPRAVDIAAMPVDVYARTENGVDSLSGNIHFFNSYDCCAREYWRNRPLTFEEHAIAIIGFGRYGQAILERAIYTNVLTPGHAVTYHIFGDASEFLRIHTQLGTAFSINEESADRDVLIFHESSWQQDHALIAQMDRIILCDDDEFAGWEALWTLRGYYRCTGRIDLRSNRKTPGLSYFGTNESIYAPEHVLRKGLNQVAIVMNELYCERHPEGALGWDELDAHLRQSKIAVSEHMFSKVRILLQDENITSLSRDTLERAYRTYRADIEDPALLDRYRRIEHQRWIRFYTYSNWSYGPEYDPELRKDPRVRPYDELTPEQKAYFDDAWEWVGQLRL